MGDKASDEETPPQLDGTVSNPNVDTTKHEHAPQTAEPERHSGENIELVSVNEEDLFSIQTPSTFIVSSFSSQRSGGILHLDFTDPDTQDPHVPAARSQLPLTPVYNSLESCTSSNPRLPIIKVQPFIGGDDLSYRKNLCELLCAYRLLLLVCVCALAILALVFGIGLGVGLSCVGKVRCSSSMHCISRSAVCDGKEDCTGGEDELNCVRMSGRSSVLQVRSKGVWRTLCSDNWDSSLGIAACRQLGYSSFVSSSQLPLTSAEPAFQTKLVSVKPNLTDIQNVLKIHTLPSISQCASGKVTVLRCIGCGTRPRFRSRIVGGNVSQPGQFPWQASLNYMNQQVCGGSIITPHWIITAAHCVYGFADPALWSVLVGLTLQPFNGAGTLAVQKILHHPTYDIALMKLTDPLTFNGLIEPICLPNFGEDFPDGHMCWISGWGATEDGGESSVDLHSAQVPLLSNKECNTRTVYHGNIQKWMICAGDLSGGTDTCQGDSGGPLACENFSVWKLEGVTSWGYGCAEQNKPGVYTRVRLSLSWIQQQLAREESQSQ
ncbi:transmembrane protease serine 3 [Denticeps clupeoides]|uniref:transmembrane protease serine 3 n=1 Tax=Denticeps clupeoides TaxID=299321 RepID=UPI0010A2D70D|nr:transmembrane protease serine 3-like [Denticeps clupeoides]